MLVVEPAPARPARPTRVVIGAVLPLTGGDAARGFTAWRGMEVAIARVNQAGGIHGLPVVLWIEDSRSTVAGARAAARELLAERPAVILGEVSSERTEAVVAVAHRKHVAVITPNAAAPSLRDLDGLYLMADRLDHAASVIGRFSADQGWTDLAALAHGAVSRRLIARAATTHRRLGGRIVARDLCKPDKVSYRAELLRVQRASPHAVLASCGARDAATILREARRLGLTVPFIAGPSWDHPDVIANRANDGVFVVTYFHPDDPAAADFVAGYRARHSDEPTGLSALAHDAAAVALDAIARARSLSPRAVEAAIDDTGKLQLATGVPPMSSTGRPSMAVIQISAGAAVFIERLSVR